MIALWIVGAALAAETATSTPRVVHEGEDIEGIAASLAPSLDTSPAELAASIRALSGLGDGEQPEVGDLLQVPAGPSRVHGGAVLALTGTGRAETPSGSVPLAPGLVLPEGSTVCTDTQSYATIRLAVAHRGFVHDDITLLSETCAVVEAARSGPDSRTSLVSLRRGSLSVRSATETPGTVTVRTRDGLATGDRGGFRVTVEDEASRTEALYSAVSVIGDGEELPLDAGYGSRVRRGEPPSPPVALPPPGSPIQPADGARLRRPDFAWSPVQEALGYRIEIASSSDFSELLLVQDVGAPEWKPELLLMPFRVPGLWWRVTSFDRTGFLGLPSESSALSFPAGMGP